MRLPARPRPILSSSLRQVAAFAAIGTASTLAYVLLFALFRGAIQVVPANALALAVTAVGNTAANRQWTFRARGSDGLIGDHLVGIVTFLVGLGLTSAAALALQAAAPNADRRVEVVVLLVASVAATAFRFLLLRTWFAVARPARPEAVTEHTGF